MNTRETIKKHEDTIYCCAISAAGAAIMGTPIPFADTVGVGAAWTVMLVKIAKDTNRPIDEAKALQFATAVLSAGAAYIGGSKLFTSLLFWVPGIGTFGATSLNMALNFIYTCRLGRYAALHLEKEGFDTGDFADIIPEITAMVFALPSVAEMKESADRVKSHKAST